jgi:hypothetical protein
MALGGGRIHPLPPGSHFEECKSCRVAMERACYKTISSIRSPSLQASPCFNLSSPLVLQLFFDPALSYVLQGLVHFDYSRSLTDSLMAPRHYIGAVVDMYSSRVSSRRLLRRAAPSHSFIATIIVVAVLSALLLVSMCFLLSWMWKKLVTKRSNSALLEKSQNLGAAQLLDATQVTGRGRTATLSGPCTMRRTTSGLNSPCHRSQGSSP